MTKSGVRPQDSSSRYSATAIANNPACTYPVRSSCSRSVPQTTSASAMSASRRSAATTSSHAAAKTGDLSYSSRPMPSRCEPCPANTKAVVPGTTCPAITFAVRSPADSAVAAARNSVRPVPSRTARCSNAERRASAAPTSAGASSVRTSRYSASRRAWPSNAPSVRPVSIHGIRGRAATGRAGVSAAASGACSSTTCALVPDSPKEDTAARRGRSPPSHRWARVGNATAPADQSMCGEGGSACRVGGRVACRMARTIFITPATPAAAWVCPMFDLIDPSHTGRSAGRSRP